MIILMLLVTNGVQTPRAVSHVVAKHPDPWGVWTVALKGGGGGSQRDSWRNLDNTQAQSGEFCQLSEVRAATAESKTPLSSTCMKLVTSGDPPPGG